MPRDGSGNYTLPVGNPVVTDTVIESDWANDTMSDVALQLNNVLTRDGVLGPLGAFKLVDGAVATPGLSFNSEPGLGMYRVNTSIIGWAAAAKQIEVLDASTAGSFVHSLYPRTAGSSEMRFNSDVYGTNDTTVLEVGQNATTGYLTSLGVGTGVAKPITHTASEHRFYGTPRVLALAGSDSRMDIDRITTATDTASLFWTTNGSPRFEAILGTGDESLNAGSWTINRYENDGTTKEAAFAIARIDGITSVGRRLDVGGFQSAGATSLQVVRKSVFGENVTIQTGGLNVTAGGITAAANNITATVGSLVAPGAGGYALVSTSFGLAGTTRLSAMMQAQGIAFDINMQFNHDPGVNAYARTVVGTAQFTMDNSGVGSSLGGWIATSDSRLKTNVEKITGALDKVMKLNGYLFDREDMAELDGHIPRRAGYMAQEMRTVLPESVIEARDEMGTLSVDHNGPIGLLIEAVKELNGQFQDFVTTYPPGVGLHRSGSGPAALR